MYSTKILRKCQVYHFLLPCQTLGTTEYDSILSNFLVARKIFGICNVLSDGGGVEWDLATDF